MDSLEKYARIFDESYKDYADARYQEISNMVAFFDSPQAKKLIDSEQFKEFSNILKPLIAIKNYKSQVPFPEDLGSVLLSIYNVRSNKPSQDDLFKSHKSEFNNLLALQGFQLPTVSAIFHFCHPDSFPIVDVNVEAACALLKERFPDDFEGVDAPMLPAANTSSKNKLDKYLVFIAFINKVKNLQARYGGLLDYRYIDKALMVLGVLRYRTQAEADESH